MTNLEATWHYRRDIASAILAYDRARRKALREFAGNSDAIQGAFCNAWGTCRVLFAMADIMLAKRRAMCNASIALVNSQLTEEIRYG
jgi:hypothetical protein